MRLTSMFLARLNVDHSWMTAGYLYTDAVLKERQVFWHSSQTRPLQEINPDEHPPPATQRPRHTHTPMQEQ
ncbi:hypothetical protein VTN49DRAFT_3620 [Thermomyces lanuginosus]|uniref:uncharacterized protein n=1 Tax=Thermomyces lanuginosus TaxID=5541 RepID=UPI0037435E3F